MKIFSGKSADLVWKNAFNALLNNDASKSTDSRIGPTKELLHVGFSISDPRQRWIFARQPAMNLAFALAEVIWLVNGRNDIKFLSYWNRDLFRFTGNDEALYGAYGFRLRKYFGIDQLQDAYQTLKANPISRQVVLQIWNSNLDLPIKNGEPRSGDIPCNIVSLLKVRDGKLEWMQILRSNDLFRGLPYDFVQFTFLQEILAGWLGLEVGSYNQISDSLHLYLNDKFSKGKIKNIRNKDDVAVDKEESEKLFLELSVRVEKFITQELTSITHEDISYWPEAPSSFQNILLVLAAEAARRRRWFDLSLLLISRCKNNAYKMLYMNWYNRMKLKSKTEIYSE
jgi:thymidylate synthase